jgi:hypothetical protein
VLRPGPGLRQTRTGLGVVLALVAGGLGGCSSIEPVPPQKAPITDPTQLYMSLTLDHPAVTMDTAAGYNTLQLVATPRDAQGTPMPDLPAPTFTSSDTTKVKVTPEGLVTAVATGSGITVTASLTVGPVTHLDSALVDVTSLATPPVLASLSIHPVPPDSAIWPVDQAIPDFTITPSVMLFLAGAGDYDPAFASYFLTIGDVRFLVSRAVDAGGAPIAGLRVAYTSLDPTVATVQRSSGGVASLRPGQVRLVAQTMAYGVAKADTLLVTVTLPFTDQMVAKTGPSGAVVFEPNEVRIAPSGYVGWFIGPGETMDTVDVVFDDPTPVGAPPAALCDVIINNIFPLFASNFCDPGNALVVKGAFGEPLTDMLASMQLRQFPTPGVYPFHSVRTGATGRVIVTTDPYAN